MRYSVTIAGRTFEVDLSGDGATIDGSPIEAELHRVIGTPLRQIVLPGRTETFAMNRAPGGWRMLYRGEIWDAAVVDERTRQLREMTGGADGAAGTHVVVAPMPGLVVRVEVEVGSPVAAGGGLVVLEAMKMENELTAPAAGAVTAVHVTAGQAVEKGSPLVEVTSEA